ncbi:MAG TPA: histidinol-phosphate transaminase [Saprospiraceae bacterium]|nr:histidinol-phosphate transaminase [Saprospiraceae bacterium]
MEKLRSLIRPNILSMAPYSSARDEFDAGDSAPKIMLDANENSFGGPIDANLARYPGRQRKQVLQRIATSKSLNPDQVFLGNGSDEAIDLLLRALVQPGQDNIIIMPPTYGMYAVQAQIQQADIRSAWQNPDFSPNTEAVLRVTDQQSKLLFLCSPNNPTGACLPESFVLEMLEKFPGIVVLDEAYQEFSGKNSWINRLNDFPNLVVLQTFSKAWGLAGIRLGMAFAHPFLIQILNNIRYPYNINTSTLTLVLQALDNQAIVAAQKLQIILERERLALALSSLKVVEKVYPSEANFLLIKVQDADGLYQHLLQNGLVVRNRNKEPLCQNCLRITIGQPEENDQLLSSIQSFPINR